MTHTISLRIRNVTFENPVFLASGPAGYGTEYAGLIDLSRLGGVVTKTITLEPRTGNRGLRLWETPAGLLNSIGLENVGSERFFAEKLKALINTGARPIVSLGAEDWGQYRRLLEVTAEREAVEIVELNLSCPNVERGGMAIGTDRSLLRKYVKHARDILGEIGILAKLTPNVPDIASLALVAEEAGADGITAINTVVGMDVDPGSGKPIFDLVRAGLSGPAILPVALDAVWRISRVVDVPVIGVGGISTVDDAGKFFMAGASGVQVGTAVFFDPTLPERIVDSLERNGLPTPDVERGGQE